MCDFKSVTSASNSFIIISTLTFFLVFILTLSNMVFTFTYPKVFETFKYIELTDYTKIINYNILMDLNFSSNLVNGDDFRSIGSIINNTFYLGTCIIDFQAKTTYNCSLACLKRNNYCYDGENICEFNDCDISSNDENIACLGLYKIKIWKNNKIKKYIKNFEVNGYSHIIPNDRNCKSVYKKCGIVNNN